MNEYVNLLLPLLFLFPLVLGVGCVVPTHRPSIFFLCRWAALPTLMLALMLPQGTQLQVSWFLLDMRLALDELSRTFLIAGSFIWWVAGMSLPRIVQRILPWWLFAMAGHFASLIARDVPSFICFYVLMSLSIYGMIIFERTSIARRAATVYIVFAMLAEVLLLDGLLQVHQAGVALGLLSLVVILIGFGIKAGLFLVHYAIPLAYQAAPLSAVIVLAGALLNVGIYGWLRFLPVGHALPDWGWSLVVIGFSGALFGVIVGLTQRNLRLLLAYSSISQVGVMCIALGVLFIAPEAAAQGLAALTLYAVHLALVKASLFYSLGVRGRLKYLLWIPILSLIGMPWTSGSIAIQSLKQSVFEGAGTWNAHLTWMLMASVVGSVLMMGRFVYLTLHARSKQSEEISLNVLPWLLLVGVLLLLPWIGSRYWGIAVSHWSIPYAVGLGVMLLGCAWLLVKLSKYPYLKALPPGDFIVLLERFALLSVAKIAPNLAHDVPAVEHTHSVKTKVAPLLWLDALQNKLNNWTTSALVFVVLTVLALVLLSF